MHIHDALDMLADGFAGLSAKGDVGHEMTIHDINMDPICTLGFNGCAFRTKIGEIGGKNRGCNLDIAVEHGPVSPVGFAPVMAVRAGGVKTGFTPSAPAAGPRPKRRAARF